LLGRTGGSVGAKVCVRVYVGRLTAVTGTVMARRPISGPARSRREPRHAALIAEQSAEYVGVSATKFDQIVAGGRMPKPKRIDGRVVWDRLQLDLAFAALPDEDGRADVWESRRSRR
jgi:predicted DNA-binding transcriptional regulator AlpA